MKMTDLLGVRNFDIGFAVVLIRIQMQNLKKRKGISHDDVIACFSLPRSHTTFWKSAVGAPGNEPTR